MLRQIHQQKGEYYIFIFINFEFIYSTKIYYVSSICQGSCSALKIKYAKDIVPAPRKV